MVVTMIPVIVCVTVHALAAYWCACSRVEATVSAMARDEVNPGDSIPKRLIRPGTLWVVSD